MPPNNDGPTVLGNVNINGIDYEVKVKCSKEDVHNYTLVPVDGNEFITGYSITYNS